VGEEDIDEDSDDSAVEDYYRYRHYESDGEEESDRYRQGVTKRCRPSLLTNSTLLIRVQMREEGGSCGVSANEYSCAHHVTYGAQINFGDLPPYLTYGYQ
jgi:hypothetical protein